MDSVSREWNTKDKEQGKKNGKQDGKKKSSFLISVFSFVDFSLLNTSCFFKIFS